MLYSGYDTFDLIIFNKGVSVFDAIFRVLCDLENTEDSPSEGF
jgi:hypothetical protein